MTPRRMVYLEFSAVDVWRCHDESPGDDKKRGGEEKLRFDEHGDEVLRRIDQRCSPDYLR